MILTGNGTKIDLTASAEQFGISTPVSVTLDTITVPDGVVISGIVLFAAIVGVVLFGSKKLIKGR